MLNFNMIISRTPIMTTMIHGRRHEIEFHAAPDNNDFLNGVAEVLHGPGTLWADNKGTSFRCISISPDRTTYIIEEVDIWRTLDRAPTLCKYTKVVAIQLTCETCKKIYNVWRIVSGDWRQDKYWIYIAHCPGCPPRSLDVWLTDLGYYVERPLEPQPDKSVRTTAQPFRPAPAIDMADFD
jgi:hypothetical protein